MKHAWRSKYPEVQPVYRTKGLLLQAIRLAVSKKQQARATLKVVTESSGGLAGLVPGGRG